MQAKNDLSFSGGQVIVSACVGGVKIGTMAASTNAYNGDEQQHVTFAEFDR